MHSVFTSVVARRQLTSQRGMAQSEGQMDETRHLMNGKEKDTKEVMETSAKKWIRLSICLVMCALVALNVAVILLLPLKSTTTMLKSVESEIKTPEATFDGMFGIIWGAPILLLVFCGSAYLHLFPRTSRRPVKTKTRKASLGARPVIVSGPFGVLSIAELLCIVSFVLVVMWLLFFLVRYALEEAAVNAVKKHQALWKAQVKAIALQLGFLGQLCLALLFLPVSRGSVLLRLIDVPFEHAAKYHVWLGHFTMTIFSVHGFSYLFVWFTNGELQKLLTWKRTGIWNLPGAIALSAGLCMWATSFQYTRKRAFEFFFYTHQLYIIFIIGMALHVGDLLVGICFAGIFLFAFDRFLRFVQSRKEVGILSAKVLPCGTCELVLPKPANLPYNALSFLFLNIPMLGRLQWHPFSVSSSPKDCSETIKFLIKPLGTWTRQLKSAINDAATARCPLRLTAAVDGPYGHETSYFLNYEALLLVAGGIGVSPFVAVIRDVLRRYQLSEAHLPKDVTLVWAVKKHEELAVLDTLRPLSICAEYASQLNLTVKAYVTTETEEDVEAAAAVEGSSEPDVVSTEYDAAAAQRPISHVVGSGDMLWLGAAILASLLGYLGVTGSIGKAYSFFVPDSDTLAMPWSVRGCSILVGILVGVWLFGGTVLLLWYMCNKTPIKGELSGVPSEPLLENAEEQAADDAVPFEKLVRRSDTVYGCRPDLQEVFEGCAKRLVGTNVGVLVCGPEGMQSSVAAQCRAFNTVYYKHHKVAFSYHSVSFDL